MNKKTFLILFVIIISISLFSGTVAAADSENITQNLNNNSNVCVACHNYITSNGTLIEDFEGDPSTYILVGGNGNISKDNVNFKSGFSSLRLITSNNISGLTEKKTFYLNMSDLSRNSEIWIYCYSDPKKTIKDIHFSLASDAYMTQKWKSPIIQGSDLVQGWNPIIFFREDWASTGGITWNDTITRLAISLYPQSGETADISVDNWVSGRNATPSIVLTFDDGLESDYATAWPLMKEKGIKGTFYIVNNYVDNSPNAMTLDQLKDLYNQGNGISIHSTNHEHLGQLETIQEVINEVKPCMGWLDENGFTRSSHYLGYPYGSYSDLCFEAFEELGIKSARGNVGYVVYPWKNIYLIPSQVCNNDTTIEQAKEFVDYAIRNQCTVFIMLHGIEDIPTTHANWSTDNFKSFLDYIVEKNITVQTHDEWYNGLDLEPMKIIDADPASGVRNMPVNKVIKITFNNPIQAGIGYDNIKVITPDNKAKMITKTINGNTLTITAKYNYTPGQTYTINIPKNGLTDNMGNTLKNVYTTQFTIATPIITSIDPVSNATNVPVNKVITVTFSEPVQAGVAYDQIRVITQDNLTKTITKTINGNTLTITAKYNYTPGTYTIYIPNGALQSLAGNNMLINCNSTFTVSGGPKVRNVDSNNMLTTKTIVVTFDKNILPGTAYDQIKVITSDNKAKIITKTINSNTLIITATYNYTAGIYTLIIPVNSLVDNNGNTIVETYTQTLTAQLPS